MSLKAQILTSLKTKYAKIGLSDKVLSGIVDLLVITTTEEADIETAVDGVESVITGLQAETDRRVGIAVSKAKTETERPDPVKPAEVTDPAKPEVTPQAIDIAKIINDAL